MIMLIIMVKLVTIPTNGNVLYLNWIEYGMIATPTGNNHVISKVVLIISSDTGNKKWTIVPANIPNP